MISVYAAHPIQNASWARLFEQCTTFVGASGLSFCTILGSLCHVPWCATHVGSAWSLCLPSAAGLAGDKVGSDRRFGRDIWRGFGSRRLRESPRLLVTPDAEVVVLVWAGRIHWTKLPSRCLENHRGGEFLWRSQPSFGQGSIAYQVLTAS